MPKVSVIIPAYNAEAYLRQAIESVLAQDFRDIEVLVIDDGSKDGTAAVAGTFGSPVRRLSKENGGVSRARNFGIQHAAGEYVAFLDADDLWEPTKLRKQVELLDKEPEVGLCFTAMWRVDANLQPIEITPALDYPDYGAALLLYSCVVTGSCSSAMVRRTILQRLGGFDPSFSTCADWEFWLRLSQVTRFGAIDEPLVKYRVTPGSMSSNPGLVERDTFAALEKFFANSLPAEYLEFKDRAYSNHWMILSGSYLHARRLGHSLRCLLQGLRFYPTNIVRPLGLPVRWLKRRLRPALELESSGTR
jgi:glycosyltransferase involved in cell wall biosynthesis